jgi:hypothetical protein
MPKKNVFFLVSVWDFGAHLGRPRGEAPSKPPHQIQKMPKQYRYESFDQNLFLSLFKHPKRLGLG